MNYMVFDIEVDAKDRRKRFCDPLEFKEHKIIMLQKKIKGKQPTYKYNAEGIPRDIKLNLKSVDLLIGHNIKFDLLYLWHNSSLRDWIKTGGKLWDTALADYLLNGQNKDIRYNLTEVSMRYGGNKKEDIVTQMLQDGKLFSQIPKDIAIKYGVNDVILTEHVYNNQVAVARSRGMKDIIEVHMDNLLAMCEIEANGLYIKKDILAKSAQTQRKLVEDNIKRIRQAVSFKWPSKLIEFEPSSNDHVSQILFGGNVKYVAQVDNPNKDGTLFYKTGKRAGERRTKKSVLFKPITGFELKPSEETKKSGIYQTGDAVLTQYDHPLVDKILEFRKNFKLLTTYYEGFPPLINPYTGCVHSEYKLIQTVTGRLASRNPNLQNLHPAMLNCFTSRWNGGRIVELDFDQLEVCIAAYIFNDSLLKTEVTNNVDIHLENAIRLFKSKTISKKQRKIAKFLTFGLLYGQGPTMMAKVHDLDVDTAKRFIKVFYDKYIDIKEAHDRLRDEVDMNRHVQPWSLYTHFISNSEDDESFIETPLGRRYRLKQYENKYGKDFSPTEMKNYKMQGTAADVVATAVGNVFQFLVTKGLTNQILMVNVVHDSLILDIHSDVPKEHILTIKEIMENTSNYLTKKLDKFIDIPLSVDLKWGKSWRDCK